MGYVVLTMEHIENKGELPYLVSIQKCLFPQCQVIPAKAGIHGIQRLAGFRHAPE